MTRKTTGSVTKPTKETKTPPSNKSIDEKKGETIKEQRRKVNLWDKQAAILRQAGTAPRDLYGVHDPFYVEGYEKLKGKVRLLWMSDIFAERRPLCPGFAHDIYKPVTPEIQKELGIEPVSKQVRADGVRKVGFDAFLCWAPEELAKEQDEIMLRGARVADQMMARKQNLEQSAYQGEQTGIIGDVEIADSEQGLHEAETRQRQELGTTYRQELEGDSSEE